MSSLSHKTDAQIQADVLEEIRWDPRVSAADIGVQVRGGVVILTGRVNSYEKKLAALEAAHRVAGVADVANDLEVVAPGGMRRSDEDVAHAVAGGWVTLDGHVDRWTDRDEAARLVHRLSGVRGVTNNIAVNGGHADPHRVRLSIRHALERQADHDPGRLIIDVHDGVVQLFGHVGSWPERLWLRALAARAPGVRAVEDNLIIDRGA
jgi:osmotically-inducible protein OsmY